MKDSTNPSQTSRREAAVRRGCLTLAVVLMVAAHAYMQGDPACGEDRPAPQGTQCVDGRAVLDPSVPRATYR